MVREKKKKYMRIKFHTTPGYIIRLTLIDAQNLKQFHKT